MVGARTPKDTMPLHIKHSYISYKWVENIQSDNILKSVCHFLIERNNIRFFTFTSKLTLFDEHSLNMQMLIKCS